MVITLSVYTSANITLSILVSVRYFITRVRLSELISLTLHKISKSADVSIGVSIWKPDSFNSGKITTRLFSAFHNVEIFSDLPI